MNEIVKIDHKEYGLEEKKAAQIAAQFQPMLDKMQELETEFNAVICLDSGPEKVAAAKECRLKYVKVRIGTAEIHKLQKAFYLAGGRYVDGWKNAQIFASQGNEDKLSEIEHEAARIEAAKIEALRVKRWDKLAPYMESEPAMLGVMQSEVFGHMLSGAKAAHESKLAAQKQAEDERIDAERKEAEAREVQRLENIRLRAEADAFQKARVQERYIADKKEIEYQKTRDLERKKQEAIQQKERDEANAKIQAEREARKKAEAEIQAQKQAEAKREADRIAKEKAEAAAIAKAAKAPEQKRIKQWIESFKLPEMTGTVSDENQPTINVIQAKFNSFKDWATGQIS